MNNFRWVALAFLFGLGSISIAIWADIVITP